jgi:hypothetical protein
VKIAAESDADEIHRPSRGKPYGRISAAVTFSRMIFMPSDVRCHRVLDEDIEPWEALMQHCQRTER